jgi:vanillate O-demethylase ferredoxin subunit
MIVAPMIEVDVASIRDEADGIRTFTLASADGTSLPPFTAGAHIDVNLPSGLTRQYSLCSDPDANGAYQIAVLREPLSRGGSTHMHETVAQGSRLRISSPRNLFPLDETAERTLLFAGGIGITPILAMAYRLHRLGRNFELHYAARTRSRAAFLGHLQTAPFAGNVALHFDDGPAAQRLDAKALLSDPSSGTHLYVCGPGGYMEHVLNTALAQGWQEAQLHWEYFSARPADNGDNQPFEIEIASTGTTLAVPAGRTALQVLHEHGFDVPVSCEQGICGTCLVPILSGIPDHRDTYLTDEEHDANDQFTPCCSRAKGGKLVLGL